MDHSDGNESNSRKGSNTARCKSDQRYSEEDQRFFELDNILRAVKDPSFVRKDDDNFNRPFIESLSDFWKIPPELVEERWRKIHRKPLEIVKKTTGSVAQTHFSHPYRRKTFTNVSNFHHPLQSRICNLLEMPVGLSTSTTLRTYNASQQSSSRNSEERDPVDVEIIIDEEAEASDFSQGSNEKSEQQKHDLLDKKFSQPKTTTEIASAEDHRGACFARYLIELMRGMSEFERAAKEVAMLRIVFDME